MVTITEAKGKRELTKFVTFPNKLYKGNSYYVSDMIASQVNDWLPDNPAFEYCEGKALLARRDGKIVGRVAAILNHRANQKFGKKYMIFSQFDFIDDDEVVDALLAAVEDYAREKGCEAVHGPMGFSDMDREGMLVEGFDQLSMFITYYNYPYYVTQMERAGYVKEIDWVEHLVEIPKEMPARLTKLVGHIRRKHALTVKDLSDKKQIPRYVRDVFELYNQAYLVLFGMVPLTPRQVDKYVKEFLPIVQDKSSCFLYNDKDELVCFGLGGPSLARANQKSRGRMLPFGWFHLLRALYGYNDRWDMFLIAVRPDLKGAGLQLVALDILGRKAMQHGVKVAETGPNLETNQDVMSGWRMFNTTQHKRRRCWVKELPN
ncbi:MAG: hypothetical protein FWE69_02245 [Clostridiales bacterium]|nr:hypothetical protein [Clostridiales bacterium]